VRKIPAYMIVVAALGCVADVTDPPEGYPVAWMVNGCSPVDGPAVELFLGETVPVDVSQPSYPHVRIGIEVGVEELSGREFNSLATSSPIFVAQRCFAGDDCISATDATVEFDVADDPSQEVTGYLRLTFADGSSLEGSFQATVHHLLILCG